jgi:peptide/nickel transport system ATP-binding protein
LDEKILSVCNIKKYFSTLDFRQAFRLRGIQEKSVRAVDDISFEIKRGEVFILAGESGSGKSTLARIILRAIDPDSGTILFDGTDITNYAGNKLREIRKDLQMIHQDPYSSLNPRMRIIDIIMEPLNIHDKKTSYKDRVEKVLSSMENVRLEPTKDIAEKYPHALSGGQRQRVALARALVLKPKLIVADEPVSMLDVSVRAEILELMKKLKEKFEISFLYITHDLSTSRYIGNEIAIMYMGKIVERGPIHRVLLDPLHPYTQALIDAISEPDPSNLYKEKTIRVRRVESSNKHYEQKQYSGCRFYCRCPYYMDVCKNEPLLMDNKETGHYVSCFLH